MLVIWQGNVQALGRWDALLREPVLLPGTLHRRDRGQLMFIGYANSDLTKCQDQMQQKSPKSVCCNINREQARFLRPDSLLWLGPLKGDGWDAEGHPELVAPVLRVHGPSDSGTGHAVCPGGTYGRAPAGSMAARSFSAQQEAQQPPRCSEIAMEQCLKSTEKIPLTSVTFRQDFKQNKVVT